MRYLTVVEATATGFSAWIPDVPGCVAAAGTRAEVLRLLREALAYHVEGLRAVGVAPPEPRATAGWVERRG